MGMMLIPGNPFDRIRQQSIEERVREIVSRGIIRLDKDGLIIRNDADGVYTDREES